MNDSKRSQIVHLRFRNSPTQFPPQSCWSEKPQRLHFGNGDVEVIGLSDNLQQMTEYLLQKDVDATVLGPLTLRKRVAERSGRDIGSPSRLIHG